MPSQLPLWRTGRDNQDNPYYVDEEYPVAATTSPELSNWSGSESSTLETDVYVWHYTLLVVHASKKEEC